MEISKQQTLVRPMGRRLILALCLSGSLIVSSGFAAAPPYNTVITTVSVGQSPVAIAVSPNDKTAYVANYNSGSISVIDASNNYQVAATTTVAPNPQYLAVSPDGTRLYVSSAGNPGTISVIDTTKSTYPLLKSFSVGSDNLAGLAVTPNGNELYVANPGDLADGIAGTVLVLDTSTYALSTKLKTGGQPSQVLLPIHGTKAYVLNSAGSGYAQFIAWSSGTIARTDVAGGRIFYPTGVDTEGTAAKLFITSQVNYVSVYDTKNGTVINQFLAQTDISTAMELGKPAVKPNGQYLYVPYSYNATTGAYPDQVVMLLVYTGTILGEPITVGKHPVWAQLAPDGDTLYVANENDGTVTVIDSQAQ